MKEWIKNLGMGVSATALGVFFTTEAKKAVDDYNKSLPKNEISSHQISQHETSGTNPDHTASFEEGLNK